METKEKISLFVIMIFFLSACNTKQENTETETDKITITRQQFIAGDMQLGQAEKQLFEEVVTATGIITPLPNGIARVYAPINGMILKVHCNTGQKVQKNQILLEIGGTAFIDMQQEFAVAAANLKRLSADYERIKKLYTEKASSEKEFYQAEAEYKATIAGYHGLKLKLESIGLLPVNIEKGNFYPSWHLRSPINGTISGLDASIGVHVEAQTELLEIINPDLLQLKLAIFPKDISNIKTGQDVRIKVGGSNETLYGKINSVGISIDETTKSITCFASLPNNKMVNPIANTFAEVTIITRSDTISALPESAFIKSESRYFLLILNKENEQHYEFTKQEIKPGRTGNGYIEIPSLSINGKILIRGGQNL
jgi:cobalt-zinc-cadmium efflux system membrane fusion protein